MGHVHVAGPGDRPGNDLAEWFPLVQATGVPTPATIVVPVHAELTTILDGSPSVMVDFDLRQIRAATDEIGYPAFLRTGHLSAKHSWEGACHLPSPAELTGHVAALLEAQLCAFTLPVPRHMVVRELLLTDPVFLAFDGMPITRERRYFARDGKVYDHHPFWPAAALHDVRDAAGNALDHTAWLPLLRGISDEPPNEVAELTALTEVAAERLPGDWSVDWLHTRDRGWVMIDAAHGEESWRATAEDREVLAGSRSFCPEPPSRGALLAALLSLSEDEAE